MTKGKRAQKIVDRLSIRDAMVLMPSTFTWTEFVSALGPAVSTTHLRTILLLEWAWIEPTNDSKKTGIRKNGKLVGGRPAIVYRKTQAGHAAETMVL